MFNFDINWINSSYVSLPLENENKCRIHNSDIGGDLT